jgi:Tol biopolymer transport system component
VSRTRSLRRLTAASTVLLVVLGTVSGVARANPAAHRAVEKPARNGLIAFMRPGKVGEFDLWVVRPNGSGLRRLTTSPSARSDYNPDWSPDGSSVVFERRVLENGTDGDDLWVVDADGSDLHQLTDCADQCWLDNEARWSPSGAQIAFTRGSGPRTIDHPSTIAIDVMASDGTGVRQLSRPPQGYEDHYATWSPDDTSIVFQRDTNANPPGRTELVAVDVASGVEHHVYTLPAWAGGSGIASFSPSGSRILFGYWCIYGDGCGASGHSARNARLATIRPDGRGLDTLGLKALADSGTWSPDGKEVAFRCQPAHGVGFRLCTSRVDGSRLREFPWPLDSAHPDWGSHP